MKCFAKGCDKVISKLLLRQIPGSFEGVVKNDAQIITASGLD